MTTMMMLTMTMLTMMMMSCFKKKICSVHIFGARLRAKGRELIGIDAGYLDYHRVFLLGLSVAHAPFFPYRNLTRSSQDDADRDHLDP